MFSDFKFVAQDSIFPIKFLLLFLVKVLRKSYLKLDVLTLFVACGECLKKHKCVKIQKYFSYYNHPWKTFLKPKSAQIVYVLSTTAQPQGAPVTVYSITRCSLELCDTVAHGKHLLLKYMIGKQSQSVTPIFFNLHFQLLWFLVSVVSNKQANEKKTFGRK